MVFFQGDRKWDLERFRKPLPGRVVVVMWRLEFLPARQLSRLIRVSVIIRLGMKVARTAALPINASAHSAVIKAEFEVSHNASPRPAGVI